MYSSRHPVWSKAKVLRYPPGGGHYSCHHDTAADAQEAIRFITVFFFLKLGGIRRASFVSMCDLKNVVLECGCVCMHVFMHLCLDEKN